MRKPEMIAAISMPEPVKERYVNRNCARSGVGFDTTGATLLIILSSPGTSKFQLKIGFTIPLNQLVPQSSRMAHTMIHGSSDIQICAVVGCAVLVFGGGRVPADGSWLRSAGDSHSSLGCQTCRKPIRKAIEISDAPMSTIHGLMKFEIKNCGIANDTPVTRIA